MHESDQAIPHDASESINIGNGDVLDDFVVSRESSDGLAPLRAPHSENYYGAMYPDMPLNQAKEMAERDQKRYERQMKRRNSLGGAATSGY